MYKNLIAVCTLAALPLLTSCRVVAFDEQALAVTPSSGCAALSAASVAALSQRQLANAARHDSWTMLVPFLGAFRYEHVSEKVAEADRRINLIRQIQRTRGCNGSLA